MEGQTYPPGGSMAYADSPSGAKINSREVASLVLGIISLYMAVASPLPILGNILGLILGIIGMVMGNKTRKLSTNGFMCCAGYVCSLIGIVLNAVFLVGMVIIAVTAGVALSEASTALPDIMNSMGM